MDLLAEFLTWAKDEPTIVAVAVFGSRARAPNSAASADKWSDVDLHVTTTATRRFDDFGWTGIFGPRERWAYAVRPASGGVKKVTVVFAPGQVLDLVIIPVWRFRLARFLVSLGIHRRLERFARALDEMSTVMQGGYKMLKGGRGWDAFYHRVVREIRGARLNDREIRALGQAFICDLLWIHQKLDRGELIAAQRVLHRSLVETNFRLLHELRLRLDSISFREARRLEKLLSAEELNWVRVEAKLVEGELRIAANSTAMGFQRLVEGLLREPWIWPGGLVSTPVR